MLSGKPSCAGGVIQPTLWSLPGHIHMLLRSTRGQFRAIQSTLWRYLGPLPARHRYRIIIAVSIPVSMQDGTLILALTGQRHRGKRYLPPIASRDNGESWLPLLTRKVTTVSNSYPLLRGGVVHITYTWNRKNIVYIVDYNEVRRYQSKPIALE